MTNPSALTGGTDTTHAARDHARAQTGGSAEAMPILPARAWPDPPEGVPEEELVWAESERAPSRKYG